MLVDSSRSQSDIINEVLSRDYFRNKVLFEGAQPKAQVDLMRLGDDLEHFRM